MSEKIIEKPGVLGLLLEELRKFEEAYLKDVTFDKYLHMLDWLNPIFVRASEMYIKRWGVENYVSLVNAYVSSLPKRATISDKIDYILAVTRYMLFMSAHREDKVKDVDYNCITKAFDAIHNRKPLVCK